MRVSVGMATYKSKRFVEEQLDSIFRQTRLPDEIVICDDASPDDTFEYVSGIVKRAPESIDVVLHRNLTNIGFAKNFEHCFKMCTGDIIFVSDADDVWMPNKIEVMIRAFEDEDVIYAFSDAVVIDAEGRVTNESLNAGWDTREDKNDMESLLAIAICRKGVPYGMTTVLRRELLFNAGPFESDHDYWLVMVAPLFGKVECLNECLVKYRRHNSNTSYNHPSLAKRVLTWDRNSWFTYAEKFKASLREYESRFSNRIPKTVLTELQSHIGFLSLMERIVSREQWGGVALLNAYRTGVYQRYRGTRNTLILDEVYLLLHPFGK